MSNTLSKKKELLHQLLSEKQFGSEHLTFVTNRQIHHWKDIGLIDDQRKYATSGMKSKFTFYEALWVKIIIEIRGFRISNISIKQIKKELFENYKENPIQKNIWLEKIVQQVILENQVAFLTILEDTSIRVIDKTTYIRKIKDGTLNHHFSLRLDTLIKELLKSLDMVSKIKKIIQEHDTSYE